ncbi:MAG: serine/threonine protein kinase [Thiotrichales bacterium]|nr:serine/threonine protein kinase [Thiotrichales bacterium]
MTDTSSPYQNLTPDLILNSIESQGYVCDGHLHALNSYENRVYQVGIEGETPLIAKFYRPGRWSQEAIFEEHAFALELAEHEIPIVAPLLSEDGESVHHTVSNQHQAYQFALYPRCGGRWPDLETKEDRELMGRLLGRLHSVGATQRFQHRQRVDIATLGTKPRDYILGQNLLPDYLVEAYDTLTRDLLIQIEMRFDSLDYLQNIRLHGDCHPGNILWTESGAHFVDLDDSATGPAIQDLWMLLSGDSGEVENQLEDFLVGYETFFEFDRSSAILIEPLRTLRIIHYAAWLARRWQDPAFPLAFPWFGTPRYWEEHILSLREQAAAMN